MNWDDVRLLLVVQRSGSIVAAAKKLGISHTTVGRRLAALQEALGVRLFDRTPAGLRPTRAAAELARDAERMEVAAASIELRLAGEDARLEGVVRVTATEALGSRFVARQLALFSESHPLICVELISEARSLSLARREADVAIRLVAPDESTSIGTRVGIIAYAPYASESYLERRAGADRERLVTYDEAIGGEETKWLTDHYASARVVFRSNSTHALLTMVLTGAGIGMLPCFLGDAEPTLRRLAMPAAIPPSPLWVVVHREGKRTARVAALRRFLIAAIRRDADRFAGRQPLDA
jgi:molybdate transport repressor ModE-like protein